MPQARSGPLSFPESSGCRFFHGPALSSYIHLLLSNIDLHVHAHQLLLELNCTCFNGILQQRAFVFQPRAFIEGLQPSVDLGSEPCGCWLATNLGKEFVKEGNNDLELHLARRNEAIAPDLILDGVQLEMRFD